MFIVDARISESNSIITGPQQTISWFFCTPRERLVEEVVPRQLSPLHAQRLRSNPLRRDTSLFDSLQDEDFYDVETNAAQAYNDDDNIRENYTMATATSRRWKTPKILKIPKIRSLKKLQSFSRKGSKKTNNDGKYDPWNYVNPQ